MWRPELLPSFFPSSPVRPQLRIQNPCRGTRPGSSPINSRIKILTFKSVICGQATDSWDQGVLTPGPQPFRFPVSSSLKILSLGPRLPLLPQTQKSRPLVTPPTGPQSPPLLGAQPPQDQGARTLKSPSLPRTQVMQQTAQVRAGRNPPDFSPAVTRSQLPPALFFPEAGLTQEPASGVQL